MKKIKRKIVKTTVPAKELNASQFFQGRGSKIFWIIALLIIVIICVSIGYIWFSHRDMQASLLLAQAKTDSDYKKITTEYPLTKSKPIALYIWAKDLFNQNKYNEANNLFDELINKYPEHMLVPAAYMGIAYCNEEKGNFSGADAVFVDISQKFPDTVWAGEALKGHNRVSR